MKKKIKDKAQIGSKILSSRGQNVIDVRSVFDIVKIEKNKIKGIVRKKENTLYIIFI